MVAVDTLRRCELFSDLDDRELALLAPLCRESACPAGETIFTPDEEADALYILREGKVTLQIRLRANIGPSGEVTIQVLEPGCVFGWSSLVKQQRFTASAVVSEPSHLISISADDLNDLFDKHSHIGFVVMKQLASIIASRLRHTRDELEAQALALD